MSDSRADRLLSLEPRFAEHCRRVEASATAAGLSIRWTQTLRSLAEQRTLYDQGRDKFWAVVDPGKVVTYARPGWSWHEYGLAADFCLMKNEAEVEWSTTADLDRNGVVDWLEVGRMALDLGLDWGGQWKKPDLPHLEWHPGMDIIQARRIALVNPAQPLAAIWCALT